MAKRIPDDHDGLGRIARQVLELLKANPAGLSIHDVRQQIDEGPQEHLDRRIREIRKQYTLEIERRGADQFYRLGPKLKRARSSKISEKVRAAVIHAAHGRCQMCGQTVEQHGVRLQADHKVPESWGGTGDRENVWAICDECNRGKRNYFSSLRDEEIREILKYDSIHERIAMFLKSHIGEPVPDYLLDTIANLKDQQWEWRKRLRELRYPCIGLEIETNRRRLPGGATRVTYTLRNWVDIPRNHKALIREHEKASKKTKPPSSPDAPDPEP